MMTEFALMWQALVAWTIRLDAHSLAVGLIVGVFLGYLLVIMALLLGGEDTRPDDWRPTITKWRR